MYILKEGNRVVTYLTSEVLDKYIYSRNPKAAINCASPKEKDAFFNIVKTELSDVISNDIIRDYAQDDRFSTYGEKTVYCLYDDGSIGYGNAEFCRQNPELYTVIPFEEFLADITINIDDQSFEDMLLGE